MSASRASSRTRTGRWRVANPRVRQSYRLNVGTIVEEAMLKVQLVRSRARRIGLDRRDRARRPHARARSRNTFIEGLVVGDTFVFGGEVVRYEALVEDQVYVSRANDKDAKVPSYMGGKFPLSTYLAERVRKLLDDRRAWNALAGSGARLAVAAEGFFARAGARASCWSKPFRAATSIISSAIRSRAGSRTRRSACC